MVIHNTIIMAVVIVVAAAFLGNHQATVMGM